MFVLVTGSRSWTDEDAVREAFYELPFPFTLIHGGAPGADTIAGYIYLDEYGLAPIVVRPDYKKYFYKAAPLKRDAEMLDYVQKIKRAGHDVLVLSFKDMTSNTGGTDATVEGAKARGLPVKVLHQ